MLYKFILSLLSLSLSQLHFDPSPLFVTVPHSTAPLGSRRWRLFQSQFNAFGKVFPVIVQDNKADTGQRTSFRESVENITQCTLQRVQEVHIHMHYIFYLYFNLFSKVKGTVFIKADNISQLVY